MQCLGAQVSPEHENHLMEGPLSYGALAQKARRMSQCTCFLSPVALTSVGKFGALQEPRALDGAGLAGKGTMYTACTGSAGIPGRPPLRLFSGPALPQCNAELWLLLSIAAEQCTHENFPESLKQIERARAIARSHAQLQQHSSGASHCTKLTDARASK